VNEQRLTPEFYTILDQCLDAVLAGRVTVETCLARFPQYADLLKPELQAAVLVTHLEAPIMEASQVDALEDRLRAQMQKQMHTQTQPQAQTQTQKAAARPRNIISFVSLPISKMAAAIMITFLLAVGSGAGVVAASSNSLPGDPLYGIKRLWEAIILLLSPLTGELDDLWLHLARTRLDEALRLAEAGQLTDEALLEVYQSTLTLIRLADPTTAAQATVYMEEGQKLLQEQKPAPQQAALYADLLELLKPVLTEDGRFQPPANLTPPSQVGPEVLATATDLPSETTAIDLPLTPTATVTPTAIPPTATTTLTHTATVVPSDTATPLFPPTATSSPTVTATFTRTPAPTHTPTTTWTPLPLPEGPTATPVSPVPSETPVPDDDDTESARSTSQYRATYWLRETQQAVYMTQTAGPPTTEEPPS
jgi:hypothetical protein